MPIETAAMAVADPGVPGLPSAPLVPGGFSAAPATAEMSEDQALEVLAKEVELREAEKDDLTK